MQCIWGCVERQRKRLREMCIVTASAIGDPLADGVESAMVALFVRECEMEVSVTNNILYHMLVTTVV